MRKVEIKVRPVTRYQVVRSYTSDDGKGACGVGSDFNEEFVTSHTAQMVADAIRQQSIMDGDTVVDHASDCAVHNPPAMPAGVCDCT